MGLETGSFIEDLDLNWPLDGDFVLSGDDHIRLVKKILKGQFPGVSGQGLASVVAATEAEFATLIGVTSSIQAQINAINTSISGISGNPVGAIIMYNGAFSLIPVNYQLCDGTNGTPDMTDQFVYGTNTEIELNDSGGSNDAVNISHSHTFTGSALAAHNHTVDTRGDTGTGFVDAAGPNAFGGNIPTTSVSAGTPSGTISTDGVVGTDLNIPAFIKFAFIRRMS